MDLFEIPGHRTTVAGTIERVALGEIIRQQNLPAQDLCVNLAMLAAHEALVDANLLVPSAAPEAQDIAVVVGTGAACNEAFFDGLVGFSQKGPRGVRPTTVPRCLINAAPAHISMRFRLIGPNYAISSACASSTTAIGVGYRMIRDGYAQRVLCGGAEMPFTPFAYAAWNNLRVMSPNPDPSTASRPFSSRRDGLVIGEAGGAILLESLESAQARDCTIRGEICGFGESSDALHITSPESAGQIRAMQRALDDANLGVSDVDLINAHGTATIISDKTEASSIRTVFGSRADVTPVVSTKSHMGHLLGASGVIETIVSLRSMATGKTPGNRHVAPIDPECNLLLPDETVADIPADVVMKNSFGFGGNNAVLMLRRWPT